MQDDRERSRGKCLIDDEIKDILDPLDKADNIILAAPINIGSPTAIMKRFMERLAVYKYWPWDASMPKNRKQGKSKKAIVITSSAAPEMIAKLFCASWSKSLHTLAKFPWGSRINKTIHLDNIISQDQKLNEKQCKKLINGVK